MGRELAWLACRQAARSNRSPFAVPQQWVSVSSSGSASGHKGLGGNSAVDQESTIDCDSAVTEELVEVENKWVPVFVRLEDYEEITKLVASREQTCNYEGSSFGWDTPGEVPSRSADAPVVEANKKLEEYPAWPLEALERLAASSVKTAERWSLALDVFASDEVGWLTTSEVAERAGMTLNEWRDAPRKLPRHLKANYPDVPVESNGDPAWPLFAQTMPGKDEVSWAVPPVTKERWAQVRKNLQR